MVRCWSAFSQYLLPNTQNLIPNPQYPKPIPHPLHLLNMLLNIKNGKMKLRLIQSWRTSILGIVLLIVAVVLLFLKHIGFSEFTAFLPTILGLLYVKDSSLIK